MSELHNKIMVRQYYTKLIVVPSLASPHYYKYKGCSEWKNWIEEESLDIQ